MRTLILLRHAKSSWDDPGLSDHERPLNRRGTRDAPRMGDVLAGEGLLPDLVLCSDAVRARGTLALVLSRLPDARPRVVYAPELYLADPAMLLRRIAQVEAGVQRLLVVGHNPGLHALALGLTGSGSTKALAMLAAKLPTAGLVVIDFEAASWAGVEPGHGRLRLFTAPKLL